MSPKRPFSTTYLASSTAQNHKFGQSKNVHKFGVFHNSAAHYYEVLLHSVTLTTTWNHTIIYLQNVQSFVVFHYFAAHYCEVLLFSVNLTTTWTDTVIYVLTKHYNQNWMDFPDYFVCMCPQNTLTNIIITRKVN